MTNLIDPIPDKWKIVAKGKPTNGPTQDQSLIIGGMGGKGQLLRYFVIIASPASIKLNRQWKQQIQDSVNICHSNQEVILETTIVKSDHIQLIILIHIDLSVDEVILPLIEDLNQKETQLLRHYLVVNTDIPPESEIKQYNQEARQSAGSK